MDASLDPTEWVCKGSAEGAEVCAACMRPSDGLMDCAHPGCTARHCCGANGLCPACACVPEDESDMLPSYDCEDSDHEVDEDLQ